MLADYFRRIIKKYDDLILELRAIDAENKAFVDEANQNPDHPEIINRMALARQNLRLLQIAQAEREYLHDLYVKELSKPQNG